MSSLEAAILTIVAGPNGSGKSTIYQRLGPLGTFVNTDDIARSLELPPGSARDLLAGKVTLTRLNDLIRAKKDIVFETTLSGRNALSLMLRAKLAGYQIGLIFVALRDEELNISRVEERVLRGGHDIPEDVVRRRFSKSFDHLRDAVALSDGALIFDNTRRRLDQVLAISEGRVSADNLDRSKTHHVRIADAVTMGLSLRRSS